ncbi:MAG: ATP-binding protein [Acidobacteriota bacterium]
MALGNQVVRIPSVADGCPRCSGTGWEIIPDGGAGVARRCECRKRDEAAQRLERVGIPALYQRCRLTNFQTHGDARTSAMLLRARTLAERYVDRFLDLDTGRPRSTGLLFIGRPGAGKTHLAAAVLTELVKRYGVRGRFVDFTSLVHQIQSTFDHGSVETKRQVLDPVIRADVLVLDELGAQKPTDWVMDNLYLIINSRYTEGLPTLFTTNFQLEEEADKGNESLDKGASDTAAARRLRLQDALLSSRISAPLVSRLYEMTQPVVLSTLDYRRQVLQPLRRL